jgi:hypothetical protein
MSGAMPAPELAQRHCKTAEIKSSRPLDVRTVTSKPAPSLGTDNQTLTVASIHILLRSGLRPPPSNSGAVKAAKTPPPRPSAVALGITSAALANPRSATKLLETTSVPLSLALRTSSSHSTVLHNTTCMTRSTVYGICRIVGRRTARPAARLTVASRAFTPQSVSPASGSDPRTRLSHR